MANAFRLEESDDKILLLTFDLPDSRVNTFSTAVMTELEKIVESLEKRSDVRGLLLRSGKDGQFIAGADLKELAVLPYLPKDRIRQTLERGHQVFTRVSQLPFPTVALIDGSCMGGGTELSLSMDFLLCSNSPKTQIGLPEVNVGIIPGWGGTQRLPRRIGVPNAINMICSGEAVKPDKAAALGLVFDAVPADQLVSEGRRLVELAHQLGKWQADRQKRRQPVGLTEDQAMFAFGTAEGFIRGKTKGQYPAPLVALGAVREGCNLPLEAALKVEIDAAMQVMGSPISEALIAVFFMNTRLARQSGVADATVKPRDIRKVAVLGSGLMGAGITAACARCGIPSGMSDVSDERIQAGIAAATNVVAGRIKIGRAKPEDLAQMLGLINTSTDLSVFATADLAVEAIVENEAAKAQVYKKMAEVLPAGAILASNTSTISITRLAESAPDASRFIGMHFFNPVDRMQLVEVIRGKKTSDETVATVVALAKRIKKTPIVVNDCAGFLVNRILFPYLNEALVLLLQGVPMDTLDKVATKFGMPMGPMLLHDVVGLDTGCFAGKVIDQAYPDRSVGVNILDDMIAAGRMGQKSGAGFRKFDKKNPKGMPDPAAQALIDKHRLESAQLSEEEIADRLFIPMLFEAGRALQEGIAAEPGDVDMGLILGIGFPPFRGGILRWCDQVGAAEILRRAEKFQPLGKRFVPPENIVANARNNARFYPIPRIGE